MKWKQWLKKYIWSILLAATIVGGLAISFLLLGELNPIIAAIGGLLFSVPIRFFWLAYTSPILAIKGIESATFHLRDRMESKEWEYEAYRIIIQKKGRSAAKNCKGYIVVGERKERICWTVPKERPNATINTKDEERIDFCAFYSHLGEVPAFVPRPEAPRVSAPTEEGWPRYLEDCRRLDEIKECKVLITADNASPIEVDITINKNERKIEIK